MYMTLWDDLIIARMPFVCDVTATPRAVCLSVCRLCLLMKLVGGVSVEEISRNLQARRRVHLLERFASGDIQL